MLCYAERLMLIVTLIHEEVEFINPAALLFAAESCEVYGTSRLAAQVLGKSVLDPIEFKWFPQCCDGRFLKHVTSSGEYLDIEFRDPDDE